jgi:hypothetical protein
MSNPIKEFLEMEKEAGIAQWWEKQPELLQRGAIAAGTFVAATAANEAYGAIKDAITRARGFKALMAHNPELAKQDRLKVQKLYNTLHTVSPDLAQDPLVANSWVNRMMYQEEYIDPKTLSDLAKAQGDMTRGRQLPDFPAAMMYMAGTDRVGTHPATILNPGVGNVRT